MWTSIDDYQQMTISLKFMHITSPLLHPLTAAVVIFACSQWLFFLHMRSAAPRLLLLSRATYLAQQVLLLPLAIKHKKSLEVGSIGRL